MKLEELTDLYNLISKGTENVPSRRLSMNLRKAAFSYSNTGFTKMAFDTRRINQEVDYIPRRGLQNYHRSEKFISDAMAVKIKSFTRLAALLDQLKAQYGKEPEWQDSYARVLASAVNKGLRTSQSDGDFSDAQPSMASLDYLEQLMYVRYRLTPEDMISLSEEDLRKAILSKDELLVSQGFTVGPRLGPSQSDMSKFSYEAMVEKMFTTLAQAMSNYKPPRLDDNLTNKLFDVKATKDAPEVERTVTINIKDRIADKLEKKGVEQTDEIKVESTDDITE